MIEAIEKNLNRGVKLLQSISDEEYSNTSIAPYYSSIGTHMRHILDVFNCILDGASSNKINLIDRARNEQIEQYTSSGIAYFSLIIEKLREIESINLNKLVAVTDDLGLGPVEAEYTLSGILIQAHSHAIHHFASVGYIISQLDIELPDADFGFNPTTPKSSLK